MGSFKLEPLLRYRKLQQELLEKALAEAQRRLDEECGKLGEFQNRQAAATRSFRQLQGYNGLDGTSAQAYTEYLALMQDAIERQQACIEEARREVRQKRFELQAAARKKKMIDKLKERHWQRDMQHLRHRERLFFDDVATNTFIRKGGPDD